MEFLDWLVQAGCTYEVTQPDDGSGFLVADVTLPDGRVFDVTVMTGEQT